MSLLLALLLDAVLGEPKVLWDRWPHPAVLMGRAVAALDARWNRGDQRRLMGVAAVLVLFLGAGLLGQALSLLPGILAEVLVGAVLLAQRSLVDHVTAVARALDLSVADGRASVAMIVGRDTATMDSPAVARAAIESAAENLSDGVVAPAFWFAVAGLPGLLIYKIINTADSMIGHRTPRYEQFGWAAARLDDVLNLIPARLTALMIRLVSPGTRWADIPADARLHRSPNAGWPESAMARSLGIALSGPRSYHGRMQEFPWVNFSGRRDAGVADIHASVAVLWRVWGVLVVVALVLTILGR